MLLSRAKEGMYILGNAQSLRAYKKSDMWEKVLENLEETESIGSEIQVGGQSTVFLGQLMHFNIAESKFTTIFVSNQQLRCPNHPGHITSIRHWQDFARHVGDGGCSTPCNEQLPCGHRCTR